MKKYTTLIYLVFMGWISILGESASSNGDSELIREIIETLANNKGSDVRDTSNKRGRYKYVNGVKNRDIYTGRDVRKGSGVKYDTDDAFKVEDEPKNKIRALGNKKGDDRSLLRAIETFLNSESAHEVEPRTWFIDDLIRGTNGTTPTQAPSTAPTTNPTTTQSTRRWCFWFWGTRICL